MKILILPGWHDAGPQHWQTLWLKKYSNAIKVVQKDWMYPKKEDWVKTLNESIETYSDQEIILVGHSLACPTIGFWAENYPDLKANIKGAMLVAPADSEQSDFPNEIQGFSSMPINRLPFNSIVVTSENDPYVSLERAQFFAQKWGSELVNIGMAGHISSEYGFGEWKEGEALLKTLL